MLVPARAELVIPCARAEVFRCLTTPEDFPKVFGRYGPLPSVVSAVMETGDQDEVGATRFLTMSDGMNLREVIQVSDPPRAHGYGWKSPGGGFGILVRSAEARMRFDEVGTGTRVTWSYQFTLSSPIFWPIGMVVARLFSGWMRSALARASKLASARSERT